MLTLHLFFTFELSVGLQNLSSAVFLRSSCLRSDWFWILTTGVVVWALKGLKSSLKSIEICELFFFFYFVKKFSLMIDSSRHCYDKSSYVVREMTRVWGYFVLYAVQSVLLSEMYLFQVSFLSVVWSNEFQFSLVWLLWLKCSLRQTKIRSTQGLISEYWRPLMRWNISCHAGEIRQAFLAATNEESDFT